MKVNIKSLNKNLSIVNYDTDDNFVHKTSTDGNTDKIFAWFAPANNYPEKVINEIRNGTTLESILFEDLIYKTGNGFNTIDKTLETYLNKVFKPIFYNTNDHFNKLGNVFLEVITDEKRQLASINTIQPQKCRLSKKDTVIIASNWMEFDKKKAVELPLYPKFKAFSKEGIKLYKSVYHIKNDVLGFDHYGINDKMIEALLLNEKEHRRHNWQLSQIKRGFKRDFFLVSEFPITKKEQQKADKAFEKMGGDDYAGGVENIDGEGAKLVPSQSNYDFDFTKDDTSDQLFVKMGFPRSLIGVKSGGAFSVEQVESDYDQYLPKVENQQTFLLSHFKKILDNHTSFGTNDFNVINTPPSIVLQNYMQYMNDEQKAKVIDNVLLRYGINE